MSALKKYKTKVSEVKQYPQIIQKRFMILPLGLIISSIKKNQLNLTQNSQQKIKNLKEKI